jgi:hypothetical protein
MWLRLELNCVECWAALDPKKCHLLSAGKFTINWERKTMSQTFFSRVWSSVKGFPHQLVKSRITLIVAILVVLAAGYLGWRYYSGTKAKVSP